MTAYYNEIEPFAAQWLRNLIAAGHIAPGDVDERSIADVSPDELVGYTQCHFFAGIGAWSYALRLAGWPDDKPVWTGSCPCQPFSCAGKGKAFDDARHLWPEWYRLIRECRPPILFGEQVDAAVRWGWLDLVQSDLEAAGYACGAAIIPAAGIGAPHIRHRLWFVGKDALVNAENNGCVQRIVGDETEKERPSSGGREEERRGRNDQPNDGESCKLADPESINGRGGLRDYAEETQRRPVATDSGSACRMGNALFPGLEGHTGDGCPNGRQDTYRPAAQAGHAPCGVAYATGKQEHEEQPEPAEDERERPAGLPCGCGTSFGMADTKRAGYDRPQADETVTGSNRLDSILSVGGDFMAEGQPAGRPVNGFWADADWLFCRDGKWRPVEPGLEPLAHRPAQRMGRLRAYGNAIVPQVAATFIRACM